LSIHLDPGEQTGNRDEKKGRDHVEQYFNKIIKDPKCHRFKCHASSKKKAIPLMKKAIPLMGGKSIRNHESDIHDISKGYYFLLYCKSPDDPGLMIDKLIPQ
jgi:hypothetical protein